VPHASVKNCIPSAQRWDSSVRKIELGHIPPRDSTTHDIRQALETSGYAFIEQDGVRRGREGLNTFQGENGTVQFFEDMKSSINNGCDDIVFVAALDESLFPQNINEHFQRSKQVADTAPDVAIKKGSSVLLRSPPRSEKTETAEDGGEAALSDGVHLVKPKDVVHNCGQLEAFK
jgi:hypothetical protein